MSELSPQEAEERAFDALIVSTLRSDIDDETPLDPDRLPSVTDDEQTALESLGTDFVERLINGEWIARRLRQGLRDNEQSEIRSAWRDLIREHGGLAKALVLKLTSGKTDFASVRDRVFVKTCHEIEGYDSATQDLRTWFLRLVHDEAARVACEHRVALAEEIEVEQTKATLKEVLLDKASE